MLEADGGQSSALIYSQLPETTVEYLFRLLQRLKPQENFNLFITWLKHPTGPDKATISEFETVLVIARAIQKFVAVYEASCKEFNDFSDWAVAQGHLPKPIIEPKYPTARKPTAIG